MANSIDHNAAEFSDRRSRLMQSLHGGAIIIASGHNSPRNNDVDYKFRQNSSFWYLTGFEEPDSVAVLRPGHLDEYVLFLQPYDPQFEIWVGHRVGVEGAGQLGVSKALPISELEDQLPKLLEDNETVYYSIGSDSALDILITNLVQKRRSLSQRGGTPLLTIYDPTSVIEDMRLIKSNLEIASLQSAIDITNRGFETAMNATKPGIYEYQVQAEMESHFRRLGSERNGYPSIVASGDNSCILHYVKNREQLKSGDLLLIDAGAEYEYYTADITRTWPVNGKFTPEQKSIYELVLEAQKQSILAIAPGKEFNEVHLASLRVLVQGLIDLKILTGTIDGLIEDRAYLPYYMHGTSHWLGLDVHDAGRYREEDHSITLQPGMVFTVEPGLYFGAQAKDSPNDFKGIGIRIEDNVLVTLDSYSVLSKRIPSSVSDIEGLVGI
jgi:Xaa-Pro aminopeptidase